MTHAPDISPSTGARRQPLVRSWQRGSRIDPRYLIAFLITLVLVAAQFRYHMFGGYDRLLLALGVCLATEALLSWFDRGRAVNLLSAYISGISLTLLIKPQGGALWPFAIGAFIAISSKYVLRYRDNHLWNPTNFAVVALLVAAPGRVSVLSHQFGNDLATNLVIWAFGLVIAARVGVLHITLTYVASFLLLNGARAAALGQPVLAELAPITGPMYQLFVFFMITDPRTIVRGRRPQILVAVVIAVMETIIRLVLDAGWALPVGVYAAPAFFALATVGPVAKWLDLRRARPKVASGPGAAPALTIGVGILLVSSTGCLGDGDRPRFQLLGPDETGVTFANTITTDDSVNVQTDVYVYNGAGVGVGDIDADGLPDIFLAGNMVSSRLYLNRGGMRFEDITEQAGVRTNRWATGVTMVDIDDDGDLDIYVSVSGPEWSTPDERANLLFLNNGNRSFREAAAEFGVADTGFTTHAVFLDYDGDRCLDLFLLTNSPRDFSRSEVSGHPAGIRGDTPGSYNQLYRNGCPGPFTNVSDRAGILRDAGYGLGVAVADLNRDGRPDIYVSNDGAPNDVLYVNNGDGTFIDKAERWIKHASYAGMGVDIADVNDDGWPDILQVDMLPRDLNRRKRVGGYLTYAGRSEARGRGFRDDYSMNTLQLSNGMTSEGDVLFSDIAFLAGVAATDWSWSALFADFDNDGRKDIFIGNGYPKAANDLDYQTAIFARRGNPEATRLAVRALLRQLPAYEEPNYIFRNAGDLVFTDVSASWGFSRPSFSYGAAYADLDADGRLDLVVNNIDAPAFIYRNVPPAGEAHHFLAVELAGESPNRRGIGATLTLSAGGRRQHLYQSPYRGYMSTVHDRAHFGLGSSTRVDTLEVRWPDGRRQVLTNLDADRVIVVRQADAASPSVPHDTLVPSGRPFQPLGADRRPRWLHRTGALLDYSVQPLLPYLISSQQLAMAVGDADGDGLDDVFLGGGSGAAGRLFLQHRDGSFSPARGTQPWDADTLYDDWGATFFDADGDGLPDLYVASGGYHLSPEAPALQDRLYLNAGGGRFRKDTATLPVMRTSSAVVRAGDFNGDGRPDLFVGGRLTPRRYPYPARSHLLRNDGGRFTDVTADVAPELSEPGGMITDAVWIDFDGDGRLDLVTAGEWMPLKFLRNEGARFRDVTAATRLPPLRGWWFSLAAGDFDGDGRQDLVAGNLGLNHRYAASGSSGLGMYAADFGGNQTVAIVLTQDVEGTEYPLAGLAPLGRELYTRALRFPTYGAFANASIGDLFSPEELAGAVRYRADTFASVYLHNEGGGVFSASPLPNRAQIAPIRGIVVHDVDGDGRQDLVVAGNLYETEPNTPRADAGNGLWLRGTPKGAGNPEGQVPFIPVPPGESGFLAPGNVGALAAIRTPTGTTIFVANTGDSLQAFHIRRP